MRTLTLFTIFLIVAGCSSPYSTYVKNTEEFVLDSYKIQQGKFAILELEGHTSPALPAHFFDETEENGIISLSGYVEVKEIALEGKSYLFDILCKAGIKPGANFFKSSLIREGQELPIDFYRLQQLKDPSQNIVLKAGDHIYIASPEEGAITILGKKESSKILPVPRGSISIREALAFASLSKKPRSLQIIRGQQKPKIYKISWEEIVSLPPTSLLLMAGDTIIIPGA